MLKEPDKYRAGMLAETWADYEASVISPAVPSWQRRDMRQSFLAGVAAYILAARAAAASTEDVDAFNRMVDEIESEAIAMSRAIDAEAELCECPGCRADRARISLQ